MSELLMQVEEQAEVRRVGLEPEIERGLWERYDYRARARIISAYQPLVFHIFGKLGLRLGEEAVDVISEGTVGLIHAVDNYDYTRGVPFKSYAYLRIKGSMIDYLRSQKISVKGAELREFDYFAQLASEGQDRYNLDRLEFVFANLHRLSPREAEIITGLYQDNLSQRELARKLRCTPANVSILHGRAIRRLRQLVEDETRRGSLVGAGWLRF